MFGDYNNFSTNCNIILKLFKVKRSFLWQSASKPQSGTDFILITIRKQRRKNPVHFRIGFFLEDKKEGNLFTKAERLSFLKELQ